MVRAILVFLLGSGALWGGSAADLARSIRDIVLDADECYRVRELTIVREDIRIYLTDGYLTFAKPVGGHRIAAVFTTDVENGDAELLVMPPTRGERRSLAAYTEAPNLNEHLSAGVLLFTDATYDTLIRDMRANPYNRKVPEMGLLAAEQWSTVVRNIVMSFENRVVLDLLSGAPATNGFFAATVTGRKLGNFDVLYDPRIPEQVLVGQVAARQNRAYFDVWTSFEARSWRMGRKPPEPDFAIRAYRIEAVLQPDLELRAAVRVTVVPSAVPRRVLGFDLAREMRISSVTVDGRPAEVLQRDSMRANLVRNSGNDLVLVVPEAPLSPGQEHEVAFEQQGRVVHEAGNQVYYVGARGNWYPNRPAQFASYDLTFRYPQGFDLVTPGQIVEDKTEGEWRITRRRTGAPIRMAGFNLGHYDRTRVTRGPYTVEVCANQTLEKALARPREPLVVLPPPAWARQRRMDLPTVPPLPPPPSPRARLQELAGDVGSALEFMASRFGPPALDFLTVSPVPGTFGQGFPGLIYLSTLTYLKPQDRPGATPRQQVFFSEILQAHETAHQWWGNVVTSAGYHDDWLMEALANYSALLYLEKRKGARTLETVLDEYRGNLLEKQASGETVDSAGPIVLGTRLESSQTPHAWFTVTYGKGSWIVHMLRRRMGDAKFLEMLAELRKSYERKPISTEQFRSLAARYMPPKSPDPDLAGFFDQWVYGTGIPALKLSYSTKGKGRTLRVQGSVTQSEVDKDFTVPVPVEIQFGRGKSVTQIVWTGPEPAAFSTPVRQVPTRVLLDPQWSVLRK